MAHNTTTLPGLMTVFEDAAEAVYLLGAEDAVRVTDMCIVHLTVRGTGLHGLRYLALRRTLERDHALSEAERQAVAA